MHEIDAVVGAVFSRHLQEIRYIDPVRAAKEISEQVGIYDPLVTQGMARTIFEYPTAEFVHQEAFATVHDLIHPHSASQPGRVTFWTDDFSNRVASSGFGELRRKLPHDVRSRLSVAFDPQDKIALLPRIAERAVSQGYAQLMVVDDSMENLLSARERLSTNPHNLPFSLVYIDRTSSDEVEGEGEFIHIDAMTHLLALRDTFPSQPLAWAIDFNGPILDREAYIVARREQVVKQLECYSK